METMSMTTQTAMVAARESVRPWRAPNSAHAVTLGRAQGRTVPFAGRVGRIGADLFVTDVDTAPITGVVYPHLEAPPV